MKKRVLIFLFIISMLFVFGCKEKTNIQKETEETKTVFDGVEAEQIACESVPPAQKETQSVPPVTQPYEEEYKFPRRIRDDFPVIGIGEIWAHITIEAAGVYNIPVYHGDNEADMLCGVGHTLNSRFPGQNGRIVIPGHVGIYRFFQRLENLTPGAIVGLNTIYGDYVYEVTETVIFDQSDLSYVSPLEEEKEDQLICFACYPYRTNKVRTQRFAIICKRISGEDWTEHYQE